MYLFTLGVMQVFSIIVFNSAFSLIKISSRMTRLYKSGRLQEETRLERGARVQEMCAGAMGTKEMIPITASFELDSFLLLCID